MLEQFIEGVPSNVKVDYISFENIGDKCTPQILRFMREKHKEGKIVFGTMYDGKIQQTTCFQTI